MIKYSSMQTYRKEVEDSREIILEIVREIPFGRVAILKRISEVARLGHRTNIVRDVLFNPVPVAEVPWHRIVKTNGELIFPYYCRAYVRQLKLLKTEGIRFKSGRLVDLSVHDYDFSDYKARNTTKI